MTKRLFFIEFIIIFVATLFIACFGLDAFFENVISTKKSFFVRFLFFDYPNFKLLKFSSIYPIIGLLSVLFMNIFYIAVPKYGKIFKHIRKNFKYWYMLHGIIFAFPIALVGWSIKNYEYFQKFVFFNGDYLVVSIILGFILYKVCFLRKSTSANNKKETILDNSLITKEKDDCIGIKNELAELEQHINDGNFQKGCVLALYGKNGSGKTSILNILESKNKNKFNIKYFEPYKYKNEEDIAKNFFNTIVAAISEYGFFPYLNKIPQRYYEIFFGISGLEKYLPKSIYKVLGIFSPEKDLENLKRIIEQYIFDLDIKILLIVDDLDRCSDRSRFLFFQLLNNFGKIKGLIYIISASAEELLTYKKPKLISIID
ncbi:hypothetical protein HOC37_05115 [bacterium]|nr:hypothetical protein [bacterium]MBT4552342.1 hypothetical protein [bacterium]MBT5988974.1 hypothetical protein [bacterium]